MGSLHAHPIDFWRRQRFLLVSAPNISLISPLRKEGERRDETRRIFFSSAERRRGIHIAKRR